MLSLNDVEQAYEEKITAEEILIILQTLQKIVSKAKLKKSGIGREFEIASGYSLYRAVQAAKQKEKEMFSLGKEI